MRTLTSLVSWLLLWLSVPAVQTQTLTYSLEGEITSVPPCVEEVFSEGERWTLEQVIDLALLVDDAETADDDDAAQPDDAVEPDDAEAAPADPEPSQESEGTEPDDRASDLAESTLTKRYAAQSFSWTIGDLSGTVRGMTRVFVSNDHLDHDSVAWQALDYSASFTPSGYGGTGIRGVQAGLRDATGSVFESLDLPDALEREWFSGEGFFQVLFQTPCGYFRQDAPLAGSVSSVEVRRETAAIR